MARPSIKHLAALCAAAGVLAACGEQEVSLDRADMPKDSRIRQGAEIFNDKCSGCHTLEASGAQGSAINVRNREKTDGPNFDTRKEDVESVLYAIRNGGFSGAIMPENLVVGDDAEKVAEFLAKYAGRQIDRQSGPNSAPPGQSTTGQEAPNDVEPSTPSTESGGGGTG
jgi:mono/diheme cytochrome c family protein